MKKLNNNMTVLVNGGVRKQCEEYYGGGLATGLFT